MSTDDIQLGSVASRLTEKGSGIEINAAQIGVAGSIYIAGACLGALFFGQLTDRYGRKKLFLITLGVYLVATAWRTSQGRCSWAICSTLSAASR